MLISEIEQLVNQWFIGDSKVFLVKYTFAAPDTLVILKRQEDIFKVDLEKSTTKLFNEFTKDDLIMGIRNGTLIYRPDLNAWVNFRELRTNGCTCGAWATRNPDCHSPSCNKYRSP